MVKELFRISGSGEAGRLPKNGRLCKGRVFPMVRIPFAPKLPNDIVPIVMRQLPKSEICRVKRRASLSETVKVGNTITKPRFCNVRCANVTHTAAPLLTERGADDLPAQLRFNVLYTKANGRINSNDTLVVKPDVPEWLSGLPDGWTDHTKPCKLSGELGSFFAEKERRRSTCFSVFSGCGGLDLGLHKFLRTIAYCEWTPACQQLLRARMKDRLLDTADILPDIQKVTAKDFSACPDVVAGGFPCQDVCVAGNKAGVDGSRTILFKEVMRLLEELRQKFGRLPHTVFLENVANITSPNMKDVWQGVLSALQSLGYDARWVTVTCSEVKLPQTRARWLILATQPNAPVIGASNDPPMPPCRPMPAASRWLAPKSQHSEYVARLHMVGNILVPQQARFAWQLLQSMRSTS
jgi:hypothetical protein